MVQESWLREVRTLTLVCGDGLGNERLKLKILTQIKSWRGSNPLPNNKMFYIGVCMCIHGVVHTAFLILSLPGDTGGHMVDLIPDHSLNTNRVFPYLELWVLQRNKTAVSVCFRPLKHCVLCFSLKVSWCFEGHSVTWIC